MNEINPVNKIEFIVKSAVLTDSGHFLGVNPCFIVQVGGLGESDGTYLVYSPVGIEKVNPDRSKVFQDVFEQNRES